MTRQDISEVVEGFTTKHPQGFTPEEVKTLLIRYEIKTDTFFDCLGRNTGMMIEGDSITYHCDIENALNKYYTGKELFWD